jgi:dolichyl-phosphate beta-glucosyltransferase
MHERTPELDAETQRSNSDVVKLSVIIPAYNEESRLRSTLITVIEEIGPVVNGNSWEVIVANDGSTDGTERIAREFSDQVPGVQLLDLQHRGKGAAVRAGMIAARGDFVLFSDADLATPISEARRLLAALEEGADVAIGSRAAAGALRLDEPFYRETMGRVFHYAVRLLLLSGFTDTQCGFKAFRRDAAQDLFQRLLLYNDESPVLTHPAVTAFDVEVLYLALHLGYEVVEVPVVWHYQAASKVNPLRDSYLLFRDVMTVRSNARRKVYGSDLKFTPMIDRGAGRGSGVKESTHVGG